MGFVYGVNIYFLNRSNTPEGDEDHKNTRF